MQVTLCYKLGRRPEPPRPGLGPDVARELLELDRRLPLVGDLPVEAEHGGDRVEEAAHRRGERCIRLQALADERPTEATGRAAPRVRGARQPYARARGSPPRRRGAARAPVRQAGRTTRDRSGGARRPRAFRRSRIPCRRRRARARDPARRARQGRRRRGRDGAAPRRRAVPARVPTSSRGTRGADRTRSPPVGRRACRGTARDRRRTLDMRPRSRGLRGAVRGTPRRRVATQNVDLSSAPTATSGRGVRSGSGLGAYPRERRSGSSRRTTESSHRRWMGRSCDRNSSAIPASRPRASSSSNAIGSSERFPLVITSARPTSWSSRWWSGVYGSITPSHCVRGATEAATGAPGRRRSRTIGRSRDSSSMRSASSASTRRAGWDVITRERLGLAMLARAQPRRPRPRSRRRRQGGSRPGP